MPGRSPGVGKTSLGKSIARGHGREFVRVSLGGVSDEAEIPAGESPPLLIWLECPGKIIQSLRTAKTSEPAVLARRDQSQHGQPTSRADPSSAFASLSSIPQQKSTFNDKLAREKKRLRFFQA